MLAGPQIVSCPSYLGPTLGHRLSCEFGFFPLDGWFGDWFLALSASSHLGTDSAQRVLNPLLIL